MTRSDKLGMLALAGIALAAMILLAAGLPALDLNAPAGPFPFRLNWRLPSLPVLPLPAADGRPISLRYVGLALLILVPFVLVYLIISPEARKRFVRDLGAALTLFCLFWAISRVATRFLAGAAQELGAPSDTGELPSLTPPAEFLASPPPWLVYGIASLLALLVVALLAAVAWLILRRSGPEARLLGQLGQEAEAARSALLAGDGLRNAVLRCYQGMLRVVREQQGIERSRAMTPREFERRLARSGLPQAQVARLTRLFERARYGARAPGPDEEREALDCLAAIAASAGRRP
ncbi:MAG: DUF4129 domain-containing protein [Chloroflexi bacterium]|nr:DUF4129 domain-containing protein [Chloroflexota bacterium]